MFKDVTAAEKTMTADELIRTSIPGKQLELVRGRLVVREAHIFRADGRVAVIAEDGALDGEDVLPGFSCALRAVLDR